MLEEVIIILERYSLPWLILAIISWLLIVGTCSFREFIHALPTGLWTMVTGGTLENFFLHHKFWSDRFIMIPVGELDLFLIIGPFFSIGIVLIRFLPRGIWLQYLAPLLWGIISTVVEAVAIKLGFLEYHPDKWGYSSSLAIYYLGLISAIGFYAIYSGALQRKKLMF